jgi:hypothetical protein
MRPRWTKATLGVLTCLLVSGVVLAVDVPLVDWEVRDQGILIHSPDGIGKAVDIGHAIGFVAVQPCRIVYTLGGAPWGATQWGMPALVQNATRNIDLNSAPHCPGIPAGVGAYSLNVTIVAPGGPGDFRMWPQDNPPASPTSVMNWSQFGPSFAIANASITPAGTNGGVTVQMAGTSGHLIIDINGYFSEEYNANQYFSVIGTRNSGGLGFFFNQTAASAHGINSLTLGAADGAAGVLGTAVNPGSYIFGVKGITNSPAFDSAGVKGVAGTGDPLGDDTDCGPCFTAGVRGVANASGTDASHGVLGISRTSAVSGVLLGTTGTGDTALGILGYRGAIDYAVFGFGAYGGTGAKYFVEPHPSDPEKVIRYVSLEGPEAGTYFRGRARFERGLARITVPDHFRMVTDAEGLTVQITPIGEMASVAVVQAGLDEIVVKSSRNVEFYYSVQGVRKTFKDLQPIASGTEYVPRSDKETMSGALSPGQKQLLIQNGTYNPDGTVNMETAQRLGWDKNWKKGPKAPEAGSK